MQKSGEPGLGMESLLAEAVEEGIFPGAAVGISFGEGKTRIVWQRTFGWASLFPEKKEMEDGVFFDLASLTKPLATTLAILTLIKKGRISLATTLSELLGCEAPAEKKSITVRQLLNHSSGLPAWRPFYEQLRDVGEEERKVMLLEALLTEPMASEPGTGSLYSDLGFMLLGLGVERLTGKGLDVFVEKEVYRPAGVEADLLFRPLARTGKKRKFAATENCPWRKRVLVGEVHDDNCHALGGVAGQAGLFGTVAGVLRLTTLLLDLWKGRAHHPSLRQEDVQHFLTRSGVRDSTWALGFDTPSAENSSAGRYLSRKSAGHLGFTGTSFWMDPERDLVVVLLTNRVHPTRGNARIKEFRPLFHDRVVELLEMR